MRSDLIVNSKHAIIQTKHMDAGVRIKPTVDTQTQSEIVRIYAAFVIMFKLVEINRKCNHNDNYLEFFLFRFSSYKLSTTRLFYLSQNFLFL